MSVGGHPNTAGTGTDFKGRINKAEARLFAWAVGNIRDFHAQFSADDRGPVGVAGNVAVAHDALLQCIAERLQGGAFLVAGDFVHLPDNRWHNGGCEDRHHREDTNQLDQREGALPTGP